MRIAYINHGRFPKEKAHGSQMCDALQELGHTLTIFSPSNAIKTGPQQNYCLRHPLRVTQVDHFDAFQSVLVSGALGFAVSMWSYGRALQAQLSSTPFDGGVVRLGRRVVKYDCDAQGGLWRVTHQNAEGPKETIKAGHLVSSTPIQLLAPMLAPKLSENTLKAASSLKYRDFLTVILICRHSGIFRTPGFTSMNPE